MASWSWCDCQWEKLRTEKCAGCGERCRVGDYIHYGGHWHLGCLIDELVKRDPGTPVRYDMLSGVTNG